jgi:hypothetical protein
MYDILYTKAPVIHTWGGYLLRVASPTTTATVTMLFLLDNKHGQRRADAIITYTLLVTTFLLDLCWLLRAAASTWTYAFFKARPSCWLYHELLCSRRWHPATSIYGVPGPATAMWRLQIVVRHHWAVQPAARVAYVWSLLVKKAVPTEIWMEYRYSKSLNKFHFSEFEELLFSKIHKALNLVLAEKPMPKPEMPPEKKEKPDAAFKRRRLFRRSIGLLP